MGTLLTREEYYTYYASDTSLQGVSLTLQSYYFPPFIKVIAYFKIYNEGSFVFSTDPVCFKNYILNFDAFSTTLFNQKLQEASRTNEPLYCVWSNHHYKDALLEFLQHHGYNAGFDIYRKREDHVEILKVAGENLFKVHDFCINRTPYLHQVLNGLSRAMQHVEEKRVALPLFPQIILPEKKLLTINNQPVYLSERELICLRYLSRGHSTKAIAHKMGISPRTAEGYIHKIKQKLGCNYKSELLHLLENEISL